MTRLIDANMLIQDIENARGIFTEYTVSAFKKLAMIQPTVDAVPVRHAKLLNAYPYGECSNCGYLIDIREDFNYCPHCGARMDEDE